MKLKINIPVLEAKLEFYYNISYDEFKKQLLKDSNVKITDKASGQIGEFNQYFEDQDNEKMRYVIWVKKLDRSVKWLTVLSHEVVHFTFAVFDRKEIEISVKNDEIFAHYFEYVYKTILDKTIYARRNKS